MLRTNQYLINNTRRLNRLLNHLNKNKSFYSTINNKKQENMNSSILKNNINKYIYQIILNRPKALNSLNLDMVTSISSTYDHVLSDNNILMILMEGKDRAFCAGGDVVSIYHEGISGDHNLHGYGRPNLITSDFFRNEYIMNYKIATCPKPQISFWDGFVMGGGVGVSIHGKFRIASETTLFSMPETGIGLFPDVGGTYFLSHLNKTHPGVGTYIGLTGFRLKGVDLINSGVATHFISNDDKNNVENELINYTINKYNNNDIDNINYNILYEDIHNILNSFEMNLDITEGHIHQYGNDILRCFHNKSSIEEIIETLSQYNENNDENYEWALKTKKNLLRMSPTSLKITLKALQEGESLSLKECLINEYKMSQGCMLYGSDFFEGIRALLVDKDNSPQWNPSSIEEVNDEIINSFWRDLGDHELVLP